jgi:Tfp pilus assembly protein FimT
MIAIAIIAIISGIATPNIRDMIQAYRLRMASTDLVSYMNMAKTQSAKQNRQWNIDLNPTEFNGYNVYYIDTKDEKIVVASINFNACDNKSIYNRCYGGSIAYGSPDQSTMCATKELNFFPNGLTNVCSIFLSNKRHNGYYRLDLLSASGIIQTQKWSGSNWE